MVALRTPEDLTPDVLTALLRERVPGVQVTAVTVTGVHQGTCTHLRLAVTYAPDSTPGLPARLFVKTQLQSVADLPPEMAQMLSEGGPATDLFRSETGFYRDLATELDADVPSMLAAQLLPGPTQFVLVGEDLTARGARFVDPVEPMSVAQVRNVLGVLARMHATYWESPRLRSEALSWLQTPLVGQNADNLRTYAFDVIRAFLQAPEKAVILKAAGLDADQLEAAFWRLQEQVAAAPVTLLHGDPHPGNLYFLPGGEAGLLDWQLVRQGSWVHDVAYCIVGALDPADRREHERALLTGYLTGLAAAGVADVPTPEHAWHLYRCSPPWGFAMWAITPPEMYTPGAVAAVLRRFAEAMTDLAALEALGL